MKTHFPLSRLLNRRTILTGAIAPAVLAMSASAADVIWSGAPQTVNVDPVYGEGLREGFYGRIGAARNDEEVAPNPNTIGGGLPDLNDIGAIFPDPPPPFNITLGVRMGQSNPGDPPDPDGYADALGQPYGWANSRTFIYTGQIQVTTGFLAFAMNNDDTDWLRINGVIVLDDNGWNTPNQALSGGAGSDLNTPSTGGTANLVAGLGLQINQWYDIEFRISDTGGGGAGPSGQGTGWRDPAGEVNDYGVGFNTTGFKQNGANGNTTPLADSLDGTDYVPPVESADGTPQLFRYLVSAGGGGDDVHVTANTVATVQGSGNSVTETSVRFEPTVAGGTVNLTVNTGDATPRTFISNSTLLANSNNVVVNIDGSARVVLNNLDDNGATGVVLNKNGGTGDLVITGSAVAGGLDGATLAVTDGRMILEGVNDPVAGLGTVEIRGANGKLQIKTKTGININAIESGTLEHPAATNDLVRGNVTIGSGKTLLAEITDGILNIGGNVAGSILRKTGLGALTVNGTTNLSGVTIEGGGRLELNGQTTLTTTPNIVSGTLALLNQGTGAQANSIPGPINIASGLTLEGSLSAFVDSTGTPNVLNLTGGTLRFVGPSTGVNLFIYDSDPNVTGAYANLTDFAAMQAHYAALVPSLRTITSNNGNTVISYNPVGDGGVPFAVHGSADADTIEALFTGKFIAPVEGDYVFDPISDDGSQVYINGTLVANNNFAQGIGPSRPGTVNLPAGAHDIVMTFNEGIGGAGMFVNVTTPGGTPRLLANSDLRTTTTNTPVANPINVQNDSTLDVAGNLGIAMASLSIQPNRKLTVTGSVLTANTVTLNGAGTYTFDGAGTVIATTLVDGSADVDIVKTGTGVLVLDNTTTPQLQNAGSSITVTGGSVGLLLGGALQPLGNAAINFNGGGVVLSSKGGNQNFAIPAFNGNGALEARQIGTGVAGPVTITLTGNLNVAPSQTVALGTADGYRMTVGGAAAGSGTVVVRSGEVETTTSTALQGLNLVVGQTGPTTLRLNANSPTLLSLGGSSGGTMIVGNGTAPATLTIGGGANARFNGAITQNNAQPVSLVKVGANTQTLGGTNTFTGGVTVNAGTLELRSGSIGTNAITLSGGTLQFIGTGLFGQFYSGDDAGANLNFTTFDRYNTYFTNRTAPTVVSSTDIPTFPTLSFAPGGGNTAMYLDYGLAVTDNIVSRMSGRIIIPADGVYTFSTRSDDGSMLYIDGQTVVANNFYQGLTTRSGTLTLTAGVHDIDIGFFEGGGDNGLVVSWSGPGFTTTDIPNTVLENSGTYDSQANVINMTSSSAIDARGGTIRLGAVTLAAGTTLTTTAGSVGFTGTTLPAAGAYNFNNAGQVILGQVTDAAAALTINKSGAGDLVFNGTAAQLTNAANVINVTGGNLVTLAGAVNPLGGAQVNLNGGGLRVSSTTGNITFANPMNISGSTSIAAGNFGPGAVNDAVVTMSLPVTIAAAQTLTARASDGYTLKFGGNVSGGGNFTASGGLVETNAALTVGNLDVTAGTLSTTGNVTTTGPTNVALGAALSFAGNSYTGGLINVNGGVVRANSGVTNLTDRLRFANAPDALRGSLYVSQTGDGILTDAGIATLLARTPTHSAALSGNLDFGPTSAGDARIFQHFSAPVDVQGSFTVAFTGKFTAPQTGAFTLNGLQNDDTMAFWIDLNQNGQFELAGSGGQELVVQGGCCGQDVNSAALNLTSGQSYNIAFVTEDTGGPGSIVARYNSPALPTLRLVNPSAAPGIFSSPKGGLTVATGAELRATTVDGAGEIVVEGTLRLNNAATGSSTVEVIRNDLAGGGAVNLDANNTLVAQNLRLVAGSTMIKSGAGTLTANSQTLTDTSVLQVDAGLVNLNGAGSGGAGSLVVNNGGTARVNGSITGQATVNSGGVLGGTGTVGPVALLQGEIAPGVAGVGVINTGNFASADGTLSLELQAPNSHDRINAVGTVSLVNNTLLNVTRLGGGPLQNDDLFFIIINDGSDAVIGGFSAGPNFGQGSPSFISSGGQAFFVSYFGDAATNAFDVAGGNDVVLRAVPEPQTFATLASGLGALVGLQRFRRRRSSLK